MQNVSSLYLEVIVSDGANGSLPAKSRSTIIEVDLTAPENPSISPSKEDHTSLRSIDVLLSATGATEVMVTGDLVIDASSFKWLELNGRLTVTLTEGETAKTVTAKFRDEAHNETATVGTSVVLDQTAPRITGLGIIAVDEGDTRGKARVGDLIQVSGIAEVGATLPLVEVLDANGAALNWISLGDVAVNSEGALMGGFHVVSDVGRFTLRLRAAGHTQCQQGRQRERLQGKRAQLQRGEGGQGGHEGSFG